MSGGKDVPVQTGHDMPQSTLYGVFTASDGHLVIAAQVDDAWKRFAAQIGEDVGHATFASDTRFHSAAGRNEHRLEILPVVREWVGRRTSRNAWRALDAIDVPCAKVQRIDEVLADPQMLARGALVEQEHPVSARFACRRCRCTSPTAIRRKERRRR